MAQRSFVLKFGFYIKMNTLKLFLKYSTQIFDCNETYY